MVPSPSVPRLILKRKAKDVLVVEQSGNGGGAGKAKAGDSGKAVVAADKQDGSGKQYCKIHRTKGHDLQACKKVEQMAELQKAEYERRDKDEDEDEDDEMDEDETDEQEFQKATEVLCVDGGASLHTSHRQLKQWVREVNAAEPSAESRKPLMLRITLIASLRSGACQCWFHQLSATSRSLRC